MEASAKEDINVDEVFLAAALGAIRLHLGEDFDIVGELQRVDESGNEMPEREGRQGGASM